MYIILEGIDGTGKTTLLHALKERYAHKDIFDVAEFEQKHARLPQERDEQNGILLKDADILFVAEPTHSGMGLVIRNELIRATTRSYAQKTLAQAYAIDREIHFKTVLLPALQRGQTLIQSRSWLSSLVYQRTLDPTLSLVELRALEGNRIAETQKPDLVCYLHVKEVETVVDRMKHKEQDVFENQDVQTRVANGYASEWFVQYIREQDICWKEIPVDATVEQGVKAFLTIIQDWIE